MPNDRNLDFHPGMGMLRAPGGKELAFIGMFAGFDAPFEVTTSELAIELLFPADRATADALAAQSRKLPN